jgi:hypothetical protein
MVAGQRDGGKGVMFFVRFEAMGRENGAGDRDRTGDIQLGKLAFYR